MKAFSSELLKDLNANSTTGKFMEAAMFVRDQSTPSVRDYFVNHERGISFNGNTYAPLSMIWSGIKVDAAMELPTNEITVSNLGGVVIDYLEDPSVDINQNDVYLQVLFMDKFRKISLIEQMLFQVELVVADYNRAAVFQLGVNYSLNDLVPRQTLEKQEFPGIRDDVIRVGS